MPYSEHDNGVLAVADLREYFHDALHGALAHQHVAVEDQTEHYVVNLLTLFARSEQLFEPTSEGPRLRPLAQMLGEALEAPTSAQREHALQRLGDVSLFLAGCFAHGFARKLVDIDYHIAMGGRAYATLADGLVARAQARTRPRVRGARREIPAAGRCARRDQRRRAPLRTRGRAAPVRAVAQDRQPAGAGTAAPARRRGRRRWRWQHH